MPVHKPHSPMGESIPLKSAKKNAAKRKSRAGSASLNLTPMVDMFTLLVVFLLANFSATGEVLFMSKEIELPKADATTELVRAPVVSISARAVSLEGSEVMQTEEALRPETSVITELTDRLKEIRRADQLLHPGQPFKGTTIIQCDAGINFEVLRKVMYAAAEAGYVDISYAVMSKSSTLGDVKIGGG